MPIDYSKFDGLGDSDDDEDDKRAGNNRGGGGGEDFEKLLQQCMEQAAKKDGAEQQRQSQREQPDLLAAAGFGATGRRRGGGGGVAVAPPAGRGGFDDEGLGSLDPYDDGFGDFDDGMGSSRALDLEALRAEAWRLLAARLVAAAASPAAASARGLLLEAEVHMLASRYRQALVAALAVQLATVDAGGKPDGSRPYGDWTAPTLVIEMVCSYQLGDRDRAMALRERLEQMDRSGISQHLAKRFEGTCEVLELVPQFLSFLQQAEKDQKANEEGGAGNF